MAKARRKSTRKRSARRNPPGGAIVLVRRNPGRRRARRNPPFSVNAIMRDTVQGAKDAAFLTVGEMATNFIARMVPITSAVPAVAVRVAVAIAAGIGAKMTLGADAGRLVLAGGLSVPLKSAVRATNVPLLTGALSSDEEISRYFRTIGAYPTRRPAGRLGSYPTRGGVGDGLPAATLAYPSGVGGNSFF